MTFTEVENKVRSYVENNQFEEAIGLIKSHVNDDESRNELSILSGQLEETRRLARQRGSGDEEVGRRFNQLRQSILELVSALKKRDEQQRSESKAAQALELQEILNEIANISKMVKGGNLDEVSVDLLQKYTQLRQLAEKLRSNASQEEAQDPHFGLYSIPAKNKFVDRPEERKSIEDPLRSTEEFIRIIVVRGMAGTGKTAIAAEAARSVQSHFRRVIWASANDAPIALEDLLDIVLRSLNYRSDRLSLEEKKNKVAELFRKAPYLLVVDSFERMRDKEVDKFLAEHLFFPSKVLITTRHMWPHEAHVITLTGLNQGQTRQMLEDIGRSQGVNQSFSGQDIHLIHSATAGNPYAVRLIIGQLSKKIPLKNTLESLQDFSGYSEGHIGENPQASELLAEKLFGNSWSLLSKNAQNILMSVTFFAAPASEEAIQKITKIDKQDFFRERDTLIDMSLFQPNRDRLGGDELRFSLHPLTRAFANAQLNRDEPLKQYLYSRAVDFFIKLAEELGRPGQEANYNRLEQDLPNCLAAFEYCRNHRELDSTSRMVSSLNHFLFERGFWNTRVQICEAAYDLQQNASFQHPEEAWRQAFEDGWVRCRQNDYDVARTWLNKAQDILDQMGPRKKFRLFYSAKLSQLEALITHGEAVAAYKNQQGPPNQEKVEAYFNSADDLHNKARELLQQYIRETGDKWLFEEPEYAIAIVDSNQGDLFVDRGHWKGFLGDKKESLSQFKIARKLYSQVLDNARKSNWENKNAMISFSAANLGHVEIWLEETPPEMIRQHFDEAHSIATHIRRTHTIAWCHRGYGLLEQRLAQNEETPMAQRREKLESARRWLNSALENFESIGRRERVEETKEALQEVDEDLLEMTT